MIHRWGLSPTCHPYCLVYTFCGLVLPVLLLPALLPHFLPPPHTTPLAILPDFFPLLLYGSSYPTILFTTCLHLPCTPHSFTTTPLPRLAPNHPPRLLPCIPVYTDRLSWCTTFLLYFTWFSATHTSHCTPPVYCLFLFFLQFLHLYYHACHTGFAATLFNSLVPAHLLLPWFGQAGPEPRLPFTQRTSHHACTTIPSYAISVYTAVAFIYTVTIPTSYMQFFPLFLPVLSTTRSTFVLKHI